MSFLYYQRLLEAYASIYSEKTSLARTLEKPRAKKKIVCICGKELHGLSVGARKQEIAG